MIWRAFFADASIRRRHVHGAIVLDVDLDAGLFDDAADDLAAGSDDVANLVGRNLERVNTRRVLGDVRRSAFLRGVHLVENEEPSAARLFERFRHDRGGDVRHLDIHLESRDAVARAGDLEIHVAVVIFGARDVGQNGVLVAFLHQAHRDAAHGRGLDRNAGIHQGERSAANGRHRAGTVGFQDVAHHADRVRELAFIGNERALGHVPPARRGRFRGGRGRA